VGDTLFDHIASLQGPRAWGSVLDAGSGRHSLRWVASLDTARWTAVTADPDMAAVIPRGRPDVDRIVLGDWTDPSLLAGEVYDTVLADYLLGAIDGFAPYFQGQLFARLRPHVGGRLYVVGLEPLPHRPESPDGRLVTEIARSRDAVLQLVGDRCYREFPLGWVRRSLEASGFRVVSARTFPNVLGRRWIDGQIDMSVRRLPRLPDPALVAPMGAYLEALRRRATAHAEANGGLRCGADHVVAAEPA
jgi:hypothetical protein